MCGIGFKEKTYLVYKLYIRLVINYGDFMDKNILKTFASESRNKLIEDVIYRLNLIGITENEVFDSINESDGIQTFEMGNATNSIYDEDIKKREALLNELKRRDFNSIVEEVAYTWFNRIIAIRFMEVNNYLPSKTRILSSETPEKIEPDVINEALNLDLNYSNDEKELIINLKNDNKLEELFRFLFLKQCNELNKILPNLFEETDDYFDLLLNISFINENGIVRNLIDNIPEEYFRNVEIIGWLYQFYISERKDAVNNALKSKPIQKKDIPAATQLFTPDWIVKYMVDNSLGRYWIERNENSSLKDSLQYLFKETEQDEDVQEICNQLRSNTISIEDLKFFDPCMGSAHILVYAFDVFMEIYKELGYLERDIPELILTNNLYGLDIDKRAYQLAYFALMMKGREFDRKLFKKSLSLNIFPIIDSGLSNDTLNYINNRFPLIYEDIIYLNDIFLNASEFGSLIQVKKIDFINLDENILQLLNDGKKTIIDYNVKNEIENIIIPLINQAKVLSLKYEAVVTNPPYLNKFDKELKDFSKKYYKDYSRDLFSMFIYRNFDFCKEDGYTAFMTPMVWMFIKNYENLRKYIIENKSFVSLIEMEYHALWEIDAHVPACTFVLSNQNYNSNYIGSFLKLSEFTGGLEVQNKKVLESLSHNDKNKFYSNQSNFNKVPGKPIAYWVSDEVIEIFDKGLKLEAIGDVRQGMIPGNSKYFLKFWYEVDNHKIGFNHESSLDIKKYSKKWFPYNKGGTYRKWYGNILHVINMENDGYEIINSKKNNNYRLRDPKFYFKPAITWSKISSGKFSTRFMPQGNLFDIAGCCIFFLDEYLKYILGFTNSTISSYILRFTSPTLNYEVEHIKKLPIILNQTELDKINKIVSDNISISKNDWDFKEISMDFKIHPYLLFDNNNLNEIQKLWENFTYTNFNQLKENEMKLDSIFNEIYGLDLVSEVENENISVYISNKDIDVKSFISYAVGCMFGRYSLDNEGLQFAGGEFDISKYSNFLPDDDNIIPVLDTAYFDDDIVGYFTKFVETCFGSEKLEENLDFIAGALSNSNKPSRDIIRDYLLKNFFNDHKKNYKKCPIYWQFSSGKENGFNCLVYMHRYEPSLVARIRTDYLHKTQKAIEQAISNCDNIINHSSSNTEINKATKDKTKLQKQLQETQEYDEALAHIANQNIEIDLDDGVKINYAKFQKVEISKEGKKSKKINLLK